MGFILIVCGMLECNVHAKTLGRKLMRQYAAESLPVDFEETFSGPKAPNPRFIFHNKIPKSGSSTMANILKALEETNPFKLRHFHACVERTRKCQRLIATTSR